mmetsp:Transcript_44740/g.93481  ORF Transcript_44740/g.93481 Transcript_44740/m.93481 type:complete len:200 (-) Transcript_44740:8-607(-)
MRHRAIPNTRTCRTWTLCLPCSRRNPGHHHLPALPHRHQQAHRAPRPQCPTQKYLCLRHLQAWTKWQTHLPSSLPERHDRGKWIEAAHQLSFAVSGWQPKRAQWRHHLKRPRQKAPSLDLAIQSLPVLAVESPMRQLVLRSAASSLAAVRSSDLDVCTCQRPEVRTHRACHGCLLHISSAHDTFRLDLAFWHGSSSAAA